MALDRKQIDINEALERKNFDLTTFFPVLLLTAAGFAAIYSATFGTNMNNRFGGQLIFAACGVSAMIVMALLPARWLLAIAYPLYAISLALLAFVMVAGTKVYGHRSWITLGGVQFQPSEIAKLATIFTIGAFLNKGRDLSKLKNIIIVSLIVVVPVGLILGEPDPGTAVIFLGLLVILLLWSGVDLFLLASIVIPALVAVLSLFGEMPTVASVLVGGAILFLIFRRNLILTIFAFSVVIAVAFSTNFIYEHLHQYQRNRVQVLLDPELDPLGAGYNVIQTRMAIGSGGLFGKGYLKGTQTQLRYVPKQWTDFIISVPSEEFGFVGAVIILMLYLFVIFRGVAIASSVRSIFSSVVAIGIAGIWFLHVTVNIGMALGLMPVIGIPLPFMSYGGSALLTNLLMAGILMNLYRNRKVLF